MASKDDRASNVSFTIHSQEMTSPKDSSLNFLTDGHVKGNPQRHPGFSTSFFRIEPPVYMSTAGEMPSGQPTRTPLCTKPLLHDELTTIQRSDLPIPQALPQPLGVPNPLASTMARDSLLAYAHSIYNQTASLSPSTIVPQYTVQMPFFLPLLLQQDPTNQSTDSTSFPAPESNSIGQPQRHILRTQLIPLLMSLLRLHPAHLPTLLLLSCVQYSLGDYSTSLKVNAQILKHDPQYVEAMSNIGTTLRAMGRPVDGELWWYRAIRLRPVYWDALDNLIGSLCNMPGAIDEDPHGWLEAQNLREVEDPWHEPSGLSYVHSFLQPSSRINRSKSSFTIPSHRYQEALDVCEFVQSRALTPDNRPKDSLPESQIFRLQNLMYTAGNLRLAIRDELREQGKLRLTAADDYTLASIGDHLRAVEIALRPRTRFPVRGEGIYTALDLVITVYIAALIADHDSTLTDLDDMAPFLGCQDGTALATSVIGGHMGLLDSVHRAGTTLALAVHRKGGGIMPLVLVSPDHALQLTHVIFEQWGGFVPALSMHDTQNPAEFHLASGTTQHVVERTHRTTATVLLTIARLLQDERIVVAIPHLDDRNGGNIPFRPSPSLVLLFYYIALSLSPSPSTSNNIGILIASISAPSGYVGALGSLVDGRSLARAYYLHGLSLDESHPHLLTNYGSLLKDIGLVEDAIHLYSKAIDTKPDFDVALVNLGNAMKDLGRTSEAAAYYRRAVAVSPTFPEAVSGLSHALRSICDWRGWGNIGNGIHLDEYGRLLEPETNDRKFPDGWMDRLVIICQDQIRQAYTISAGVIGCEGSLDHWLGVIERCTGRTLSHNRRQRWVKTLKKYFSGVADHANFQLHEASFIVRIVELLTRIVQRRWYTDVYGLATHSLAPLAAIYPTTSRAVLSQYARPIIPNSLITPSAISILPFHSFTYSLSARAMRLIAHRNAIRISYTSLMQSHLPSHVYPPPPPSKKINIGYVSSDINNHPLAHLMQGALTMHESSRFNVFIYALAPSDGSAYRIRVESNAQNFRDVSGWTTSQVAERIVRDQIHILINLNGYTKGARNDVFAARPAPIQMSLMGYAGTLAAGWCDYLITDTTSSPPHTSGPERWLAQTMHSDARPKDPDLYQDPESSSEDWTYTEKFIYMPHTFFVTNHKQSFPDYDHDRVASDPDGVWLSEEIRRWELRREIFPDLSDTTTIFANFSQLYKFDPVIFAAWLRILARVPNSILWLLRFPPAGEEHLIRQASLWGGEAIARRIRFTDVATKEAHIARGRVADLFLDTIECSAHTIASDVLWSGTPIVTWPKHDFKMCSRVGASIARATGLGDQMIVSSLSEYEQRAVSLANSASYAMHLVHTPISSNLSSAPYSHTPVLIRRSLGPLADLRRTLYLNRSRMPLFDTLRWTRNLEKGFDEAWRRWVHGTEFLESEEWDACVGPEKQSSAIWIKDDDPFLLGAMK